MASNIILFFETKNIPENWYMMALLEYKHLCISDLFGFLYNQIKGRGGSVG